MVLAFGCLGILTATALCHSDGMHCLAQVILIKVHRSFSTLGQFLQSLYGILLEPGAEADLTRWMTCLTSLSLGGDVSNRAGGSEGLGTYLGEPRGWAAVLSTNVLLQFFFGDIQDSTCLLLKEPTCMPQWIPEEA